MVRCRQAIRHYGYQWSPESQTQRDSNLGYQYTTACMYQFIINNEINTQHSAQFFVWNACIEIWGLKCKEYRLNILVNSFFCKQSNIWNMRRVSLRHILAWQACSRVPSTREVWDTNVTAESTFYSLLHGCEWMNIRHHLMLFDVLLTISSCYFRSDIPVVKLGRQKLQHWYFIFCRSRTRHWSRTAKPRTIVI